MNVAQGEAFEAAAEFAVTGLLATARVRIDDNQGATVVAAQPFDRELGTSGVYVADMGGIGTLGQYTILSSLDGSFDPETVATEELVIYDAATPSPDVPPLVPISGDGMGQQGPCMAWTSVDAMVEADCCTIEGSDPDVLEPSIVAASQLLYPLSGKKYAGTCEATARPPCDPCGRQARVRWVADHWESRHGFGCGCRPLSRVALAGHVRSILEVTIDGEVVDPDTYEVRDHLWLVRLRDPADLDTRLYWPACQDMDVALGEEGTFGITYEYGFDPPSSGILAAQELACAIYETCSSDDPADCPLPQNITKIERQGITIELAGFSAWGLSDGKWQTGLPLVDAFLNAENPKGRRGGRAQVWSPDLWGYARPVTTTGS